MKMGKSGKRLWWFLALAWAFPAGAAEVLWVEITPILHYRDLSTACSTEPSPWRMYFGAEADGGEVKRAVISRELNPNILTERIELLPEETAGIVLYRDEHGRAWVRHFPMSGRLLVWFLFHSSNDIAAPCRPSMKLASVGPVPGMFDFPTESMQQVPGYSVSPMSTFQGRRVDGSLFEASLYFDQRQLRPERS